MCPTTDSKGPGHNIQLSASQTVIIVIVIDSHDWCDRPKQLEIGEECCKSFCVRCNPNLHHTKSNVLTAQAALAGRFGLPELLIYAKAQNTLAGCQHQCSGVVMILLL